MRIKEEVIKHLKKEGKLRKKLGAVLNKVPATIDVYVEQNDDNGMLTSIASVYTIMAATKKTMEQVVEGLHEPL